MLSSDRAVAGDREQARLLLVTELQLHLECTGPLVSRSKAGCTGRASVDTSQRAVSAQSTLDQHRSPDVSARPNARARVQR